MRKYFLLFLLLQTACSFGQKVRAAHPHKPPLDVPAFYARFALQPDSACTPHLYYAVYDWIGTHYRYGGSSKKGIDCSGFVAKMYQQAYCIQLSGGSKDLWTRVKPIERDELEEGDILFFKIKKGQISHVGIYLGNNKFAHASVQNGVIVSDLDETYYKKYFYKGGRLNS